MAVEHLDSVLRDIACAMRKEDVLEIAHRVMCLGDAVINQIEQDHTKAVEQSYNIFIKWKGLTGGGRAELRQLFKDARAKGIPVDNKIFELISKDAGPQHQPPAATSSITPLETIAKPKDFFRHKVLCFHSELESTPRLIQWQLNWVARSERYRVCLYQAGGATVKVFVQEKKCTGGRCPEVFEVNRSVQCGYERGEFFMVYHDPALTPYQHRFYSVPKQDWFGLLNAINGEFLDNF